MKTLTRQQALGWGLAMALCAPELFAGDSYSPYAGRNYPVDVYWGDTHLHTNLSIDANGMGNKALTPEEAYRFAKGETVTAHNGMQVRLRRPLDFLVVADHAENIGVMSRLEADDPVLLQTETGRRWHALLREHPLNTREILTTDTEVPFIEAADSVWNKKSGVRSFFWEGFGQTTVASDPVGYIGNEAFRRSVWQEVGANAERHNQPGRFTAFIGYEWTSVPATGAIHRVVLFKDGAEKTDQVLPFTAIDSQNPEKLWKYLADYARKTGGDALAIPHNSNLSRASMFSLRDFRGRPFDKQYAIERSYWEPLLEATQIKGDSETHPLLSPSDEFADYETWYSGGKDKHQYGYARSALKLGLDQQVRLGVNPFKFGMIGSTDAHTAFATADEDNFLGKASLLEPSPYRMRDFTPIDLEVAAAGYAAVWATENTREALFDAMKRKEVYASTGPRMTVRFFGGWDFSTVDALRPDLARLGYTKGVPMGGDLIQAPRGKAPSFLIRAVKDPDGANLDRVQVIKGWRSADGELHEKVYNVALSDGRVKNKNGNAPSVGNTVDIADASYTNTIGDPELAVVWVDPDFKPNELAFYYVRVLEIPTPRWTAYDAKYFDLRGIPDDVPMVTQERAYTSPIWYMP